jgi:hypothetical protein
MNELNPYAKYLHGEQLEAVLSTTAGKLETLIAGMGTVKTATPPGPGKWSPAEIVCHLADCELAFGFRLRQAAAEEKHVIQPFDQEKWAVAYPGILAADALAAFAALRKWNLAFIVRMMPEAAEREVTHPERGTMTFATIVETMAGHDVNHLVQMMRLAEPVA